MILVDTSVWVEHLRRSSPRLSQLLEDDQVLVHRFVIGELALSGLGRDAEVVDLIQVLPPAGQADHEEVLELVERWKLAGRGIGWIDAHLFASALLSEAEMWTNDRSLKEVCRGAGIAFAA